MSVTRFTSPPPSWPHPPSSLPLLPSSLAGDLSSRSSGAVSWVFKQKAGSARPIATAWNPARDIPPRIEDSSFQGKSRFCPTSFIFDSGLSSFLVATLWSNTFPNLTFHAFYPHLSLHHHSSSLCHFSPILLSLIMFRSRECFFQSRVGCFDAD